MFCNHSTPTTVSFKQTKVETELVTSIPSDLKTLKPPEKSKQTRWTITYRTTVTLFYPARRTTVTKVTSTKFTTTTTTTITKMVTSTKTITETKDKTFTTTFATYIPPSTVCVVKTVVAVIDEEFNDAFFVSLGEFNSHGLWGITISLFVVAVTLIFVVSM